MGAGADHQGHQGMPGGVEFGLVDAAPGAVEARQRRAVGIGQARQLLDLGAAEPRTERVQLRRRPAAALALQRFLQCRIAGVQVDADEWRRLVLDLVGGESVHRFSSTHICLLPNVALRHHNCTLLCRYNQE